MKKIFCFAFLFIFLLTACSAATTPAPTSLLDTQVPIASLTVETEPRTLTVFAAASLTDAFEEIGQAFEASHPGVTVRINFAGSQALRTQIEQGALVDVFASANSKEMDTLVAGGLVTRDIPQIFLINQLIVILPDSNPAGLEKLEDLANPGIKLVLAADDVPVGKYARQALDQMNSQFGTDFKDKVLFNVVSNEDNVKQVVVKVQLGEADAGIVYASDAVAAPDVKSIEIPADMNVIAEYPIAVLTQSPVQDLASDFVAYVFSPDGQAILQKWGFGQIR
jgi:molybdate transport system substrate-binding protein